MKAKTTPIYLINNAINLISDWENRPVRRAHWHRADELLCEAAMLDADGAMDAWEHLLMEYEAWLLSRNGKRRAA